MAHTDALIRNPKNAKLHKMTFTDLFRRKCYLLPLYSLFAWIEVPGLLIVEAKSYYYVTCKNLSEGIITCVEISSSDILNGLNIQPHCITAAPKCTQFTDLDGLRFNVPVNKFSVMSGWSHCLLGIYQYFGELKVSCSRTLQGDLGVQTWDL